VKWSSTRCRSRAPSSFQCSTTVHRPRPPSLLHEHGRRPPQPLRPGGLPLRNTRCTYRSLLALGGATLAVARRRARCLALRRAFHFGGCCDRVVCPSPSLSLLGRIKVVARVQRNARAGSQFLTWAWQTDAAPSQPLAPPRAPVHGPSHPQSLAVAVAKHHSAHVPHTTPHSVCIYMLHAVHLDAVIIAATMCRCHSSSFVD
jgi:hypothetical protein